jgi:hypothetical protein
MKNQSQYAAFKNKALELEPLSKQVSLAEIELVDGNRISHQGVTITLSDSAMSDLAAVVGMPKRFGSELEKDFTPAGKQRFVNLIKSAKVSRGKNPTVTLVATKGTRVVSRVFDEGSILPYEAYFDTFERLMNSHKMDIQDFGHDSDGKVFISTVSKKDEFQIGKRREEVFHPGFTFTNDIRTGTTLESYLHRLVCTNGMIGRGFGTTFEYNVNKMNEFFDSVNDLRNGGFLPPSFKDKVEAASCVRASWAEVKAATELITQNSKLLKEDVDKFVPYNSIRTAFLAKGVNPAEWNGQQSKNAITNVTVWDVINGVTDFASHDYGFEVNDHSRLKMQLDAGSLLSKSSYDTQNLVHIAL